VKTRVDEITCSNCGQPAHIERGDFPFIRQDGLNVHLYDLDLVVCQACGNVDPIIPRLNDVMRAIAQRIVSKRYRLTGAEVRFLRKYIAATAEVFSRSLHVDKTTVSKWENDEHPVGEQSDLLIRSVVLLKDEKLREAMGAPLELFPEIKQARRRLGINCNLSTGDSGYAYAADTLAAAA
jgi:DNA-binding transcriptional regulator YiaG